MCRQRKVGTSPGWLPFRSSVDVSAALWLKFSFERRATTPPHLRPPRLATELGADRRRIPVDETLGEGSCKYGPLLGHSLVTHG